MTVSVPSDCVGDESGESLDVGERTSHCFLDFLGLEMKKTQRDTPEPEKRYCGELGFEVTTSTAAKTKAEGISLCVALSFSVCEGNAKMVSG